MPTTKHTPGPWRWIRDGLTWMLVRDGHGQPVVIASNTTRPGDDQPGEAYLAVREDNPARLVPLTPDHPDARLIAAAPMLLAALEADERAARHYSVCAGCGSGPDGNLAECETFVRLRAEASKLRCAAIRRAKDGGA